VPSRHYYNAQLHAV